MPANLFYTVTIPVSLWFLRKNKTSRKDEVLFIDARNIGYMETRVHRELWPEEIKQICDTYHSWKNGSNYRDISGYCKSANIEEVASNNYSLLPGLYVGIEKSDNNSKSFENEMKLLTDNLSELFKKSEEIEKRIKTNLKDLGYEI